MIDSFGAKNQNANIKARGRQNPFILLLAEEFRRSPRRVLARRLLY
ncbi:MAG: hypothetical protein WED15_01755 [Akkermansiaceae bacterium]